MSAQTILEELQAIGNPAKATHLARFFKTGKGQYGEGDLFLGITVPEQRAIAKRNSQLDLPGIQQLVTSPWHEARLTGLLILLERFNRNKCNADAQQACIDFYLANTQNINNWDLVDLSCYKLLGVWLEDKDRSLLYRLAASTNLWEQRIAIVTCMHFVRRNDFTDCLAIATQLLHHPHDLIHKAVGWLLREIGKKDRTTLTGFLQSHARTMPRTMLRYAIEHFPEEERKKYLRPE